MKWLRGSTRETKIRQAVTPSIVKLASEKKNIRIVERKLESENKVEYNKQDEKDFWVNERNDH